MADPVVDTPPLPPAPPRHAAEDPEVLRLRAEVSRQGETLNQLRQRFTAQPQPAVQPQQHMSQAEMSREFFKDPVNHTAAIAGRIAQDALRAQDSTSRDTLIAVARTQVRSSDPTLFDRYSLEIENAVQAAGPQFSSNINVWQNAFKLVKGAHIDEILADRAAAPPDPARAPAVHISTQGGPAPASTRPAAAPKGDELNPQEKRVARKLGITEAAYIQGKKDVENQNDPVMSPVGASSWDPYITFSSRDKLREARAARKAARK